MPVVSRAGVGLHYLDVGAGPAVFFHTGGGGDGRMWDRAGYLRVLPGRRHLLHDHRGHGLSDKPEGLEAHQLEQYVADAAAVLDAAEVDRAALVGYSDAAHVLFALAGRRPDRVSAIVQIGGVPHPGDRLEERRQSATSLRKIGMRAALAEMAQMEDEPAPDWLMENLCETPTEMFALELEGWADAPNYCDSLSEIGAPTLIVCGERENADGAAELAVESLRDGAVHVIPGFGHLQAFWRADVTGPIISSFLDSKVPV